MLYYFVYSWSQQSTSWQVYYDMKKYKMYTKSHNIKKYLIMSKMHNFRNKAIRGGLSVG